MCCVNNIFQSYSACWSNVSVDCSSLWKQVQKIWEDTLLWVSSWFDPEIAFVVPTEGISVLRSGTYKEAILQGSLQRAGGTGGACFIIQEGERIGVFKPVNQPKSCQDKICSLSKSHFGQAACLSDDPCREIKGELAAAFLAKFLGLSIVPCSTLARIGAVVGLKQELAVGIPASSPKAELWLARGNYTVNELILFQKFALFDFILGNLDRHKENWFLSFSEEEELIGITAIDNANGFPHKASSCCFSIGKQYAWAHERIAAFPLQQEVKTWIQQEVQPIDVFFDQLENDATLKGFVNHIMKDLLRLRFQAAQSLDGKPQDLLHYRDEICLWKNS
ncbi:MAG: hypothetical protein FJZ58_06125 [Chlamydiae bacterium]|nr:hypothetical protein [Chlamydiota bacterium]